jgi:hypothetical protein
MSESSRRLIALHHALTIFPPELLPIMNDYVKVPTHEWDIPIISSKDVTMTKTEVHSRSHNNWTFARAKYCTNDGPSLWAFEARTDRDENALFDSIAVIELECHSISDYNERICFRECVSFPRICLFATNGTTGGGVTYKHHYDQFQKKCPRIVMFADPPNRCVTVSYITETGVARQEKVSLAAEWSSYRPCIRMLGHVSVSLVTL